MSRRDRTDDESKYDEYDMSDPKKVRNLNTRMNALAPRQAIIDADIIIAVDDDVDGDKNEKAVILYGPGGLIQPVERDPHGMSNVLRIEVDAYSDDVAILYIMIRLAKGLGLTQDDDVFRQLMDACG